MEDTCAILKVQPQLVRVAAVPKFPAVITNKNKKIEQSGIINLYVNISENYFSVLNGHLAVSKKRCQLGRALDKIHVVCINRGARC